MILYENFIKLYDDGSLEFNDIEYRKGAPITEHFSIAEGYKENSNGGIDWGYVRIHTGVDRSSTGRSFNGVLNPIISPFDFEKSRFEDYHGKDYGTLVVLISAKFEFEFRVAHMYPEKILILNDLKENKSIARNTIIGPAGTYGLSSAIHTHTEVKSIGSKSEVLEELLKRKFGESINKEYTNEEIISNYRQYKNFKAAKEQEIFNDWKREKEKRKCLFINKYLYRYIDFDNKTKTRYSSELLWNGL
jgi:murein DD-endopeptidase MepM/ murein hydrolase activator NlpD